MPLYFIINNNNNNKRCEMGLTSSEERIAMCFLETEVPAERRLPI